MRSPAGSRRAACSAGVSGMIWSWAPPRVRVGARTWAMWGPPVYNVVSTPESAAGVTNVGGVTTLVGSVWAAICSASE